MHILLTDRLSCPRCGPEFGLILLAQEVRDRRIQSGEFGCFNCREQYPVTDGFGDLRAPPRTPLDPVAWGEGEGQDEETSDPDAALRLAALLGVTAGPGTLLLLGPAALHAPDVAGLVFEIEVVGLHPALQTMPPRAGVSRMIARPGIPFFSGTFLGVVYSGPLDERLLLESVRVTAPLGRIAVLDSVPEVRRLLEAESLGILMDEDGVLVAQRGQRETSPTLITLRGL